MGNIFPIEKEKEMDANVPADPYLYGNEIAKWCCRNCCLASRGVRCRKLRVSSCRGARCHTDMNSRLDEHDKTLLPTMQRRLP